MEISLFLQWKVLLYALILGAALGVFFDILRLLRLLITLPAGIGKPSYYRFLSRFRFFRKSGLVSGESLPKSSSVPAKVGSFAFSLIVFIEDILFFTVAGLSLCLFLFWFYHGEFRFFALFGTAVGFFLYRLTVGRLSALFSEFFVFCLRAVLSFLWLACLLPLLRGIGHCFLTLYRLTLGRLIGHLTYEHSRRLFERNRKKVLFLLEHFADGLDP